MENNLNKNQNMFTKNIGFIVAGVTAVMVLIDMFTQSSGFGTSTIGPTWSNLFRLAFVIYYCMLIYRIHKIVAEQTNNEYPITPGKAVGFLFIPFFNIYWLFKWHIEMAKYVNSKSSKPKIERNALIALITAGILVQLIPLPIEGGVYFILGLATLFLYIYLAYIFYDSLTEASRSETSNRFIEDKPESTNETIIPNDFKAVNPEIKTYSVSNPKEFQTQFIVFNIIAFSAYAFINIIILLLFKTSMFNLISFFGIIIFDSILIFALMGAIVGFAQWLFLKKYDSSMNWPVFTIIAYAVFGLITGLINPSYIYAEFLGFYTFAWFADIFLPLFVCFTIGLAVKEYKASISKLIQHYMLPWIAANIVADVLSYLVFNIGISNYIISVVITFIILSAKGAVIGFFLSKFFLSRYTSER